MKFRIDKFVLAIIGVVLLAAVFPQWGGTGSKIPLDTIGDLGISLIFFFYGLKLSPQAVRSGLVNWKLHLLVQASTFVLFPIIVIVFYPFVKNSGFYSIWLGFLFMAALPSTVSSSVVMVAMAKGNVPAAIFNASISGLIGIAITPLWVQLFVSHSAGGFDLGSIYLKLLTEILLPVVFGLWLHRYWGKFALKNSRYLTLFDKTIILVIIFKSFAISFEDNVFGTVSLFDLLWIIATTLALFFTVYGLTGLISRLLKFNREDQITAQFCGSKKSLVHGTVFSNVLFPPSMPLGIILLPLMIFHALQIFIVSIIAGRMGKEAAVNNQSHILK